MMRVLLVRGLISGLVAGLLALVFAWIFGEPSVGSAIAYGRIGQLPPRATAAVLALGGYLVVSVVPLLKYPASPLGVGAADSIEARTGWYGVMIVISVLLAVAAAYLGRRLLSRLGAWHAALAAAAVYVITVAAVQALLPSINEVPEAFPPTVLWDFRVAALGTQLVMWATLGLLFGALITPRHLART